MKKVKNIILGLLFVFVTFISCSNNDDKPSWNGTKPSYDMSGFAKGADVSWLTQMENSGYKFYHPSGREMECMTLLRDLGMNSIRLRVWVNPQEGWCNKKDVLVKAWRANNLGMRIMIDFHYSDVWADPGAQEKPVEWETLTFDELKLALAEHTQDVLNELKDNGIAPEWVQVGNETGNGMLFPDGKAENNMKNYADLNNAGYDAVKAVFPKAKVIVHLQNGDDNNMYKWLFDGLKSNAGKWDVIGMSLYPSVDNWQTKNNACIANMKDMISRYGSEVMVCEVGMPWDQAEESKEFLSDLIHQSKAIPEDKCLGVFYWEPQSYKDWNGYKLGAFDNSGFPTVALDAFK